MFGIFLFFFILSIFMSSYMLEAEPEKAKEMLDQIEKTPVIQEFKRLLNEGKYINIAFLIFLHNFQIAILNYFFGIGFLFSVILQISNAFLIGFMVGMSPEIFGDALQSIGFVSVMILEVVAITAAAVEGMYLTYTFIRPERMWKTKSKSKAIKKTLEQSIKIILLSAFLLFLAAAIETLVIYRQSLLSAEPVFLGV